MSNTISHQKKRDSLKSKAKKVSLPPLKKIR